jgi:hypothetical protein
LGPAWRTRRRCARPPTATARGAVTRTTTTPRTSLRTALPSGEADGGSRSGRLRQTRWLPLVGPGSTATRGSALVGVLPEPVHGRRAGVEHRDVSVVRAQPQFCLGAAAREPLAVRAGHDPILATMQDRGSARLPARGRIPTGRRR